MSVNRAKSKKEVHYLLPHSEKVFTTAEKKALCKIPQPSISPIIIRFARINNACQKKQSSGKEDLAQDVVRPKPIEVSGPVLRVFPLLTVKSARTRVPSCTELNGKYVTASDTSHVVFVQNCQRRLFPDTVTFEEHRGKLTEQTKIVSIPELALRKIKRGRNFVSALERVYEDLLPSTAPIEIIPIDEACSGIVNTYVSYLGEIFFIEKQPESQNTASEESSMAFSLHAGWLNARNRQKKIYELTATQAQSIPEGKPSPGF